MQLESWVLALFSWPLDIVSCSQHLNDDLAERVRNCVCVLLGHDSFRSSTPSCWIGGVKVLYSHSPCDSEEITHVQASFELAWVQLWVGLARVCNQFVKAFVHLRMPDAVQISEQLGTSGSQGCLYTSHFTEALQIHTPKIRKCTWYLWMCLRFGPNVKNTNSYLTQTRWIFFLILSSTIKSPTHVMALVQMWASKSWGDTSASC